MHDISTDFALDEPVYHEAELMGRELSAPRRRIAAEPAPVPLSMRINLGRDILGEDADAAEEDRTLAPPDEGQSQPQSLFDLSGAYQAAKARGRFDRKNKWNRSREPSGDRTAVGGKNRVKEVAREE